MKRGRTIGWIIQGVLTLMLLMATAVYGQRSALSNAASNAARYQFIDASEIYAGAFSRGNRQAALNAGDNLYRARKYSEALPYFRIADSLAMIKDPETLFQYFECLKSEKRYAEADALVKKNLTDYAERREFQLSHNKLEYYKKIESFKGARLKRLNINSPFSDISPTVYGNWLYFVSTRVATNNKDIHRINMQPFYNLYALPKSQIEGIFTDEDMTGQLMKTAAMPKGNFGKPETTITYVTESAPSLPNGINQKYHDGPIFAAPSGNLVFFTTNWSDKKRPKSADQEINLLIYYIEKNSNTWSMPKSMPFNSFSYSCQHGFYDEKSSTLYFSSNMPGGQGGFDIWTSTLRDGNWSEPKNLGPTVNTPKEEVFPALTPDGRLIFSSNGWPGLGGLDLFLFENKDNEPINLLSGINTEKDDFNLIFTDKESGYLVSNRNGGVGDDDIYSFSLDLKQVIALMATPPRMVVGKVRDASTGQVLDQVMVSVSNYFRKEYKTSVSRELYDTIPYDVSDETKPEILVRYEKPGYEPLVKRFNSWPKEQTILDISAQLKRITQETPLAKVTPSAKNPPVANPPRNESPIKVEALDNQKFIIYFNFDKYNIRKDASEILAQVAYVLLENYEMAEVLLTGHTDTRGSYAYNEQLSKNRVNTAKKWLVDRGVDPKRIKTDYNGEIKLAVFCTDPLQREQNPDKCLTSEQHQLNRRVEIEITNILRKN